MAFRVYSLTVTVPAGTLSSAPQSTTWFTEDNTIVSIEVEIPPGHNGQTGIRFMKGDVQLLPFGSNSWIIANNVDKIFPINQYTPTGDLKVQTYNAGLYTHTFYLRITIEDYIKSKLPGGATESEALALGLVPLSADPLSPDMLLGVDTVSALTSGSITAADLTPGAPIQLSGGAP